MEKQILYSFIKLDLAQFATFETDHIDNETNLELSCSFQFAYSPEHVVCCTTTVIIKRGNSPILKAGLDSYFKIQPDSVVSLTEDDYVVLPTFLMTQFASLGYGTMRGLIYAKTMGTNLENIILPPNDVQNIFITPAKFLKSDKHN